MTPKRVVADELEGKVDAFLVDRLKRRSSLLTVRSRLPRITSNRFDLAFKLIYLDAMDTAPGGYAKRLYDAHVMALSLGLANEPGNAAKMGLDRFRSDFRQIRDGLRRDGFDPERSLVPLAHDGTPLNGAHRISAAIALGLPVIAVETDLEPMIFDQRFFRDRGVPETFLLAAALRAVEETPDAQVVLRRRRVRRGSPPLYSREVTLTERGLRNLDLEFQAQGVERWGPGAEPGPFWVDVHLSPADTTQMPPPVYASEGQDGALALARLVLNDNSRHRLNTVTIRPEARIRGLADRLEPGPFAYDMEMVLGAYAIRDPDRVLYRAREPLPDMAGAERCEIPHAIPDGEILADPRHHFFAFGRKFVPLRLVAETLGRLDGDARDAKAARDLAEPPPPDLKPLPRGRLSYHRARRVLIAVLFSVGIGDGLRRLYRRFRQ